MGNIFSVAFSFVVWLISSLAPAAAVGVVRRRRCEARGVRAESEEEEVDEEEEVEEEEEEEEDSEWYEARRLVRVPELVVFAPAVHPFDRHPAPAPAQPRAQADMAAAVATGAALVVRRARARAGAGEARQNRVGELGCR
jgi:hypothetical protein